MGKTIETNKIGNVMLLFATLLSEVIEPTRASKLKPECSIREAPSYLPD